MKIKSVYLIFLFSGIISLIQPACKKDDKKDPTALMPLISTEAVIQIGCDSATCGGTVTYQGTSDVSVRGVCWSLSQHPTILDSHTTDGGGLGKFSSSITGLLPLSVYYVRAYATNSSLTFYGPELSFTTIATPDPGLTANSTIAALLIRYPGLCDYVDDSIIISGIITANDESGNFYKQLVIQDESAGVEIRLDRTNLFTHYKRGQKIFIKCQGMFVGRYGGLPLLGGMYNGAIGQLSDPEINQHIYCDGLPGFVPDPMVVTPSGLNFSMVNKLVRIEDVRFVDAGLTWADGNSPGTHFLEGVSNLFEVRTSNFANFATLSVPYGSGTIEGILSYFSPTFELILRDSNDIIGFDNDYVFFSESFANGLNNFTTQSIVGDQNWAYNATYGCVDISGFQGGNYPNEDWLISPSINLSDASRAVLRFAHAINKGSVTNVLTNHTVWISKNYSSGPPSTATWEQLLVTGYPSGANWSFVSSGDIILPTAFLGEPDVKIAFKYISSNADASTWEVKNIIVTN